MMKYLLIALAITAISAEILDEVAPHDDTTSLIDEFLENDMQLPCTPKTCKPVCKLVTKYVQYGAYKLPYQENVCVPDKKCLADAAACIAKLQAAMKAAEAAEKDMIAKAKLANAAKATKAQKDAAAAAKKKEEAAAASALAAAKAAFEAAEKEAAFANAASISAASSSKNKNAEMAKALAKYEAVKTLHLQAQAAYAGAKSAAAKALADYTAAVKAHCDAEAKHAEAVKYIGHPQHEVKTCRNGQAKPPAKGPAFKVHASCKKEHTNLSHCVGDFSDGKGHVRAFLPAKKTDKLGICRYKKCGTSNWINWSGGKMTYKDGKAMCAAWGRNNHNYVWELGLNGKVYRSSEENAKARGTKVVC
jgi:hypothetical protein